jgi:hypothetical protein
MTDLDPPADVQRRVAVRALEADALAGLQGRLLGARRQGGQGQRGGQTQN